MTGRADREFVLTRRFNAPRDLVWQAWTDPAEVVHWWGPRGFTLTIDEMDVRTGGFWKSTMRGPDGTEYLNDCVFTEVIKPERIAYRLTGGRKAHPDIRADVEFLFEAHGRQTIVTLRMRFDSVEARDRAAALYRVVEGGQETLQRFADFVVARVTTPD